ncbi:hypothetical protein ACFW5D_37660, partial [Streptomyces sp. NPDC058770]
QIRQTRLRLPRHRHRSSTRHLASHMIDRTSPSSVLITIGALEITETDYAEATLAPALAKQAETEFGLPPRRGRITRDNTDGQFTFSWDE